MQSQIICNGCRNIIYYPRGAANVRCAVCSTVSTVAQAQPTGTDMDQLICGGCRTLLMYARGATTVRCLCCHTMNFTSVNVPSAPNQFSTISCGNCHTVLMYTYGAPSVKCAICHFVTNVDTGSARFPSTADRLNGAPSVCSTSAKSQTVVVENPTSVDESGKLVTNVVVGVTTEKK